MPGAHELPHIPLQQGVTSQQAVDLVSHGQQGARAADCRGLTDDDASFVHGAQGPRALVLTCCVLPGVCCGQRAPHRGRWRGGDADWAGRPPAARAQPDGHAHGAHLRLLQAQACLRVPGETPQPDPVIGSTVQQFTRNLEETIDISQEARGKNLRVLLHLEHLCASAVCA